MSVYVLYFLPSEFCPMDDCNIRHPVIISMLVSYMDVWSSGRNILKNYNFGM